MAAKKRKKRKKETQKETLSKLSVFSLRLFAFFVAKLRFQ